MVNVLWEVLGFGSLVGLLRFSKSTILLDFRLKLFFSALTAMPLLDYRMWICNEQQIIGFIQAATSGAEE